LRILGIEIAGDYNSTAIKEATVGAEQFGRTVTAAATKNIERLSAQRLKLQELAGEYRLLAASAEKGSVQQIAAADLAAKAQKRLGLEVLATNSAVRTSARETALAERQVAKFARGSVGAAGGFGKVGIGLAMGSGGFLAGAAVTAGIKSSIDAAKELMGAEEQLSVAIKNTGAAFDKKQLEEYLAAESKLSVFTKAELTGSLVGLVRVTGSMAKAQADATLAANVARGTGLDLATVTQKIIAMEAGRTRGVQQLGIHLPVVKTAQDALTASGKTYTAQQHAQATALDQSAAAQQALIALQQKYHDSAKVFGASDAASTIKFSTAINTLEASIGTVLLPTVTAIATPFAKWAQAEADSGDAAKKTKEIVGDLTGILKTAKTVIHDVDDVTGGFKHTLELLIGLKFASSAANIVGGFTNIGAAAGEAGAAGKAGLLLSRLKLLGAIGVLAIGIDLIINAKSVDKQVGAWLDSHGLGFLSGDKNSVTTYKQYESLPGQLQNLSPAQVVQLPGAPGNGGVGIGKSTGDSPGRSGASTASGRAKMLQLAANAIGTPYLWGGNSPGGFDCSGLVQWAFANGLNVNIPRTTYGQAATGKLVGSNTLKGAKAGDVIFTGYGEGGKAGPGHEGIYVGGGQVLAAPHTGAKVGITSLAGFTGGGSFTVRDLLAKVAGGSGGSGGTTADAAAAAAIAALIAGGKAKAVKAKIPGITTGSSLIGDKLNGLINLDKNNASDMAGSVAEMWLKRELANLEAARKTVAAQLKGASSKQATAIKAELRTIDTSIAGVNKSITTNLKEQAAAIKAAFAPIIAADKQAISSAFSNLITDIQTAFSAATQAYIADTLGPKFSQGGLLTAKEQQYADMQAADTAKSLTDGLTAAQKALADDMNGALIEHIVNISTGATRDIFGAKGTPQAIEADKAAIDQAQRMIDENNLSIDATAERKTADRNYANAVTQYQQQRSVAEHAMTTDLNELGKGIAAGTANIGDLPGVLGKYGLTTGDIMVTTAGQFGSDLLDLGTATSALAKVMMDEAAALARIGDGKNAAQIQATADSIGWQTPVSPGQSSVTGGLGGAAGYFLLNPIPHMASGGDILRDGLAYLHAGERVQPADVAGGRGGTGTIVINVNAPNYVGSHNELAAALKHPSVLESVSVAVIMGSRRGHIKQSDIRP